MDIDTFEEVMSESRVSWRQPKPYDEAILEGEFKAEYKPYIECPRCSEWKLAARIHRKRHKESKGFLRGSTTEWRVADRWWECKNCAGKFDVTTVDRSEGDAGGGPNRRENDRIDDVEESDEGKPDGTPKSYKLDFIHQSGASNVQLPVKGGEKGIVRRGNIVQVPAVSAKFRLPLENGLWKNTEVKIQRRDDGVYCVPLR